MARKWSSAPSGWAQTATSPQPSPQQQRLWGSVGTGETLRTCCLTFPRLQDILGSRCGLFVLRLEDVSLRFVTTMCFACFYRIKYRQTPSHTRILKDGEESPTVLKSTAF